MYVTPLSHINEEKRNISCQTAGSFHDSLHTFCLEATDLLIHQFKMAWNIVQARS